MSVSSHVRRVMRLGVVVWLCAASPLWAAEPEDTATLEEAYLHWQRGYVLHAYGDYHEAIASFRRSIEAHPTAEGHTFLGWSLSHLGRVDEAIAQCKADEAVPWLEKAMGAQRYCCYEYPHANRGRIHLMKGQLEAAKRAFDRALSYDPGYLPALQGLRLIEQYEGTAL